jgi:large conductance mechanosensitive channel
VFKGFREFILRGNVIDLAVGIVIGAAFGKVIDAFVAAFLTPLITLITLITGGAGAGGKWTVNDVDFPYGTFISALITFLLTALALYYLVVVPANAYARRRGRTAEDEASDEVRLLTEIRDRLPSR